MLGFAGSQPEIDHPLDGIPISRSLFKEKFIGSLTFMRLFFRWKKIVLTLGLVFVFSIPLFFTFTSTVDAALLSGIVPCGLQADDVGTVDSDENSPCTLCHLVIGVKRIVDWAVKIMTYFALVVIVAMGILYIVSVGDTKMTGMAKEGLKAILFGFALMLLIWLFVAVVLVTLARPLSDFKTGAMWWQFTCSTKSNVGTFDNGGGGNGGAVTPPGGGSLDCKTGRCATKTEVAAAVKNNSSSVNPNIVMSIIDAGEGCNKSLSSDGYGSCGYSQALPAIRTKCGITGTPTETCRKIQNDAQMDINCAAWLIKANAGRCGMNIRNVASCYNSGKPNNCPRTTKDYCGRVERYFNSCK